MVVDGGRGVEEVFQFIQRRRAALEPPQAVGSALDHFGRRTIQPMLLEAQTGRIDFAGHGHSTDELLG